MSDFSEKILFRLMWRGERNFFVLYLIAFIIRQGLRTQKITLLRCFSALETLDLIG